MGNVGFEGALVYGSVSGKTLGENIAEYDVAIEKAGAAVRHGDVV